MLWGKGWPVARGTGRAGVRARAAAHAGRAGAHLGQGWAGLKPTQPAQRSSTPGSSPAHSSSAASQLPSERRPGALPPTGAESSGCLRNARHCLRTDGWSVSLCAAHAGHEARAMRGKPGYRMPTFDRAAATLTSRLQRMRRVFCSRLSAVHRRSQRWGREV